MSIKGVVAIFSIAAALPTFAQDPGRTINVIGEFSNMRVTEEHAYGYALQLWRDGNSVVGLLFVSEGLQGDTPTGILENVKFDPRTGALSFTAKLTTGLALLPGGRQEPTRDLFEFSGSLGPADLSGSFTRSDMLRPTVPVSRERVQLKMKPSDSIFAAGPYADWRRRADEILKYRGPKW